MMKFRFKEGDKVIVNDEKSFYKGQIAEIVDSTHIDGINVYWVRLVDRPSIHFAVSEDNLSKA